MTKKSKKFTVKNFTVFAKKCNDFIPKPPWGFQAKGETSSPPKENIPYRTINKDMTERHSVKERSYTPKDNLQLL
jgi:hypothetical protein